MAVRSATALRSSPRKACSEYHGGALPIGVAPFVRLGWLWKEPPVAPAMGPNSHGTQGMRKRKTMRLASGVPNSSFGIHIYIYTYMWICVEIANRVRVFVKN